MDYNTFCPKENQEVRVIFDNASEGRGLMNYCSLKGWRYICKDCPVPNIIDNIEKEKNISNIIN